MKRFFCLFCVILFMLNTGALAAQDAGESYAFFLTGDDHRLLVQEPNGRVRLVAEEYVLSYYYAPEEERVYYTAMVDGLPTLCWAALSQTEGETVPLHGETEGITLLSAPNHSVEEMVDAAMTIIYRNEGNYGSINKNDNGAVSIGKVQWHANRALNLLKTIVDAEPRQAERILGEALYQEIVESSDWSKRTVNAEEAAALSDLLKTEQGMAAQDALAAVDITAYVNHAISLGLESSLAIVYFADLENQWGASGATKQANKARDEAGSMEEVTLDILHQACLNYTSKYHARRQKVYDYCVELGWDEFLVLHAPENVTVQLTDSGALVTWDPVESAEFYECHIALLEGGFVEVACEETEELFFAAELEPGKTYFAYVMAHTEEVVSESSLWVVFDTVSAVAAVCKNAQSYEVEVSLKNAEGCQLLAVGYQQGRQTGLQLAEGVWGENRFTLEGDYDEIRVMVLDSASLKPLCGVLRIEREAFTDVTPPPDVEIPTEPAVPVENETLAA